MVGRQTVPWLLLLALVLGLGFCLFRVRQLLRLFIAIPIQLYKRAQITHTTPKHKRPNTGYRMYINHLLSRYSILMSTKMLRMMVKQAMQLLTPTKLVVEMMSIPVVTPMAMDVLCVCMSLMMSSKLKQQEKPRKSKTRYCQGFSGDTSMKGQSQAAVVRRKRLIWLQMAQGLFVGSPRSKEATMPKMMLGANLKAYAGLVHSIVIDPPTIAPKMIRQKHPCLPANVSQIIAKIIPPEAFQPNQRQRQAPIDVKMAMILSLSSWGLVGRKGMIRFFLIMKIRLQTNVTSIVKKTS